MISDSEEKGEEKDMTNAVLPTRKFVRKECANPKSLVDLSKFKISTHSENVAAIEKDTDAVIKYIKDKNL